MLGVSDRDELVEACVSTPAEWGKCHVTQRAGMVSQHLADVGSEPVIGQRRWVRWLVAESVVRQPSRSAALRNAALPPRRDGYPTPTNSCSREGTLSSSTSSNSAKPARARSGRIASQERSDPSVKK